MRMTEKDLFEALDGAGSAVLFEPPYKRKYPPVGLMKLATHLKRRGTPVAFSRQATFFDVELILVATLFTYDKSIVMDAISQLRLWNPKARIIVGGVFASVKPELFEEAGCDVFKGFSPRLDLCPADYEIDWLIDERWEQYSYFFTARGCPNKCGYCFVPKIEKGMSILDNWQEHIHPDRPRVVIHDNNLTAFGAAHVREVGRVLRELGKKANLDNAVDCKHLDEEMCEAMADFPIESRGIRTAFDRMSDDGIFQDAMERLQSHGVSRHNIVAYVLYNYKDTVREADYRARECVRVGVQAYPACYQPINAYSRRPKYISKNWTARLTTAFTKFYGYSGFYREMTFVEYCRGIGGEKHKLGDEDLAKLDL